MKCFITLLFLCSFYLSFAQQYQTFTNRGIKLFYEEKGKGPALYILTGGPGAHPADPGHQLMDSLKDHYTVVLLHQRGAGKSRNIPINEKTINVAAYTSDVEALRKYRNDKTISLLGYSWGGLLAMNYAVTHPDKMASMVLMASAPPTFKEWHVLEANQYARFSMAERDSMQMSLKVFSTKTPGDLEKLKLTNSSAREVVAYKNFVQILHRVHFYDRALATEKFDSLFYNFNFAVIPLIDEDVIKNKIDLTARLKKLNTPTLIIYGRQDDQGEYNYWLQHQLLKNSELKVIEKAGHYLHDEQPQEFYKALIQFLTRKPTKKF